MEFKQPETASLVESYTKAKKEVAEKMGIPFNADYNGNILSRDAGRIGGQIGGQMVRKMVETVELDMQDY